MCNYTIVKEKLHGFDIEVAELGNAENPVIVFAHGLGGNLRQWEEQFAYFSSDYKVIAFSLQGHGDSSKPNESQAYTIERYGDVAIALLNKRNIASCIWVGNSMGGVIGYEIMKRQHGLIEHLVTNGTAPVLKYGKAALKMIGIMDTLMINRLGYERYIDIAVKASLKDPSKRLCLKRLFMLAHPMAIIESHQLLGNYDYLELLHHVKKPVTFIMTPKDKDINKAVNKYRSRLEAMSNVTIIEHSRGGHVINMELPNEYNRILASILEH